jgi:hypothetical protein
MVGSPYLLPGFIVALGMCALTKSYYQALIFMLGVVYCADDQTFYTMVFVALVWILVSHYIAIFRGD